MQCVNMYSFFFLKVILHRDKSPGYIVYIRQLIKKAENVITSRFQLLHNPSVCLMYNTKRPFILVLNYAAAVLILFLT